MSLYYLKGPSSVGASMPQICKRVKSIDLWSLKKTFKSYGYTANVFIYSKQYSISIFVKVYISEWKLHLISILIVKLNIKNVYITLIRALHLPSSSYIFQHVYITLIRALRLPSSSYIFQHVYILYITLISVMHKIHSTSQSVISCCSQLETVHKILITSIRDFLLSSTWDHSQYSYHFNQWFPAVLNLRPFTRFLSLQSEISCCPQLETIHNILITSISDFLLSSTWDRSQDSYHFNQWSISCCPQLETVHKILITSVSDFLLSSKLKCFARFISLQSVISCCSQLEVFKRFISLQSVTSCCS